MGIHNGQHIVYCASIVSDSTCVGLCIGSSVRPGPISPQIGLIGVSTTGLPAVIIPRILPLINAMHTLEVCKLDLYLRVWLKHLGTWGHTVEVLNSAYVAMLYTYVCCFKLVAVFPHTLSALGGNVLQMSVGEAGPEWDANTFCVLYSGDSVGTYAKIVA